MNHLVFFILLFILGMCVGSFLNVVIWRLPRNQKLTGRSKCARCHHILSWKDLFPVASFLIFKGRCKYCNQLISFRYPVIEMVVGLLFVAVWFLKGSMGQLGLMDFFIDMFFVCVLVVVFMVDVEHFLILDKVLLPVALVVGGLNIFRDIFLTQTFFNFGGHTFSGVLAAMIGFVSFFLLWYFSQGKALGFGDVKFAGVLGLFFGWPLIVICLMFAFFSGSLFALPLLVFGKANLKTQVPFGAFLSFGAFISIIWGEKIVSWYFSFLGFY